MALRDLDPARAAQWRDARARLAGADAEAWEAARGVPREVFAALAARAGEAPEALDLLAEAAGATSASLASLLTVHAMVVHAVQRFGSAALKQRVLPGLRSGELRGGFALSEPGAGTDLAALATEATWRGDGCRISGHKTWLSGGQDAHVFLVFARSARGPLACLIDARDPGVRVAPIDDMAGFRAARLASLALDDCAVAPERWLGRPGAGLSLVALDALTIGRLCVAWASCGVQRASLAAAVAHVHARATSRGVLGDEPGVRSALCEMQLRLEASQSLALAASAAVARRDVDAAERAMAAKLFASAGSAATAGRAVELLGARGCSERAPVARYLRDAKVLEIIEGANDVLRIFLGGHYATAACAESEAT